MEATNDNGVTPLFEAIWVGRPPYDFAKTKPSEKDLIAFQETFYTRMENMPRTVQILLDAGASIDNPQKGYPGGKEKNRPAFTTIEWLKEQLSWQDKNPDEKDPKVKEALKGSLKIINQHLQQKNLKKKNNQNV